MNLYDILELNINATEIEIKKAYFRLAKKYHPDKNTDKNKEDTTQKFQQIQSAYEILINNNTRNEYLKMTHQEKQNFSEVLEKIINNNFNYDEIKKYFNSLNKNDYDFLQNNFMNFIQSININDLINIFTKNIINKNINVLTETETDIDNSDNNTYYYYKLPLYLLKINKLDIKLELSININDINNKKKIKIIRNINNKPITSTLFFNLSHPYIVVNNFGDVINNYYGNLIIKLNLAPDIYWDENIILFEKPMNLYEMIYGLDIFINFNNQSLTQTDETYNNIIDIKKWIPYRDGNIIDLNNYNYKILNYNLAIKLYLNYENTDAKEEILKMYFLN